MTMRSEDLLVEISDYCRTTRLAESTFGRLAVNDGKLVSRLREGGRVTTETVSKVRAFIESGSTNGPRRGGDGLSDAASRQVGSRAALALNEDPQRNFCFFANRQ